MVQFVFFYRSLIKVITIVALNFEKEWVSSSTVSWQVYVLSTMVGPYLTGLVCILDTIFIDRNTAGQMNRRKDAQNLTMILLPNSFVV